MGQSHSGCWNGDATGSIKSGGAGAARWLTKRIACSGHTLDGKPFAGLCRGKGKYDGEPHAPSIRCERPPATHNREGENLAPDTASTRDVIALWHCNTAEWSSVWPTLFRHATSLCNVYGGLGSIPDHVSLRIPQKAVTDLVRRFFRFAESVSHTTDSVKKH